MTKKLFWQNPYLTTLDTVVTSVVGNQVTVAETVLFAFSGGQESDHGTIAGHSLLAAEKVGQEIYYELPAGHGLQVSQPVTMTIDWQRRHRLMRLHFAAEILLELAVRDNPKLKKIGAHIGEKKARIDFLCPHNLTGYLSNLQHQARRLVNADEPIETGFSDEASEQRYWKIAGFSQVPCGGTHVRSTREVGEITLKRVNLGKHKERVEIYVA